MFYHRPSPRETAPTSRVSCPRIHSAFGTLLATFIVLLGFTLHAVAWAVAPGWGEATVFSCDYNGWTDVPEAEREAIEAFELAQEEPLAARVFAREHPRLARGPSSEVPRLKAA